MAKPRCDLETVINDPRVIEKLWKIYTDSFAGQETECGQNQICFAENNLRATMHDPEWLKFILLTEKGEIAGFGLSSSNLNKSARIAYANPEALVKKYGHLGRTIFYLSAIVIAKKFQNQMYFSLLMMKFYDVIICEKHGMGCFDHSMNKNPHLAEGIRKVTKELRGDAMTAEIIDTQIFMALIPNSP